MAAASQPSSSVPAAAPVAVDLDSLVHVPVLVGLEVTGTSGHHIRGHLYVILCNYTARASLGVTSKKVSKLWT